MAAVLFLGLAYILIVGAPVAVTGQELGDPGPALLPRLVGCCTGLLAVLLFLQKPELPASAGEATEDAATICLSLLAIPAFYLMFQTLGYTAATGIYLAAAFYILGNHDGASLLRYALAATAFSLSSGLIFSRLLELPLPGVLP